MEGHTTAIHRTKPSAPAQWLWDQGLLVGRRLDFGCGHGIDAEAFRMDGYDPHWKPIPPAGPYNTITCIYVLNVVGPETQEQILTELRSLLASNGRAYVAVRRDLPPEGKQGRKVWQRFVTLDEPVLRATSGYVIYEITR